MVIAILIAFGWCLGLSVLFVLYGYRAAEKLHAHEIILCKVLDCLNERDSVRAEVRENERIAHKEYARIHNIQKQLETEITARRRFQEQCDGWFDALEENLIAVQDKLDKIKLPKTWGKMRKVKGKK